MTLSDSLSAGQERYILNINFGLEQLKIFSRGLGEYLGGSQDTYIIFLLGDLGMGKTTLSQSFIHGYLQDESLAIVSPTYTYYKNYGDLVHFDTYRVTTYDDFVSIGGEEALDNARISLIEWPQIISRYVAYDICISLSGDTERDRRQVLIETRNQDIFEYMKKYQL